MTLTGRSVMPCSYTILPESRFVYTRGWGVVTDAMVLAQAHALKSDPRFQPSFAQLYDLRDATLAFTSEGLREVALMSPFGAGARRAFVSGSSDAIFGMVRMYEALREPARDQVMGFHDMHEALRWLGNRAPSEWQEIPALLPDWLSEKE
ncbi:MAG: hypothetical protein ACHQM4_11065 [Thermoanaerobaculia bacterium]